MLLLGLLLELFHQVDQEVEQGFQLRVLVDQEIPHQHLPLKEILEEMLMD